MNHTIVTRPNAETDIASTRDWYENQQSGLGRRFLVAIDDVFALIQSQPMLFAISYRGVRCAPLTRFPYIVYYRLIDEGIEVIAVMHGSRSEQAWHSRS